MTTFQPRLTKDGWRINRRAIEADQERVLPTESAAGSFIDWLFRLFGRRSAG